VQNGTHVSIVCRQRDCYDGSTSAAIESPPTACTVSSRYHGTRSSSKTWVYHRPQHCFTFRLCSTSWRTSFDGFSGLNRWLSPLSGPLFTSSNRVSYDQFLALPKQLEFVFGLDVQQHRAARTVTDARINILHFLRSTREAQLTTTIRCKLSCSQDGNQTTTEAVLTLDRLRRNAFMALSFLLVSRPWRKAKLCPIIYVNGNGYAVEIFIPGHKTVQKLPDKANEQLEHFEEQL
jgi:hypothetical protein